MVVGSISQGSSPVRQCLFDRLGCTSPIYDGGRVWSWEEKELHINVLEMKLVILALDTFYNRITGESVVLMSLKKHGGTVLKVLCDLAQEIVPWSELQLMALTAKYLSRKMNILADQLSRPDQVLPTGWSLLPWVFDMICEVLGHPHVDLFATRANTKLLSYVSLVLDPMAWKQDAFQHPWDDRIAYAFPHRSSSSRVVKSDAFNMSLLGFDHFSGFKWSGSPTY